jgi:hypothetical protein
MEVHPMQSSGVIWEAFQDNPSAGDYLITVTDLIIVQKTLIVNIPKHLFLHQPGCQKKTSVVLEIIMAVLILNLVGGITPVKLT